MATAIRFVSVAESDVMAILELRRQIWATTYRGIYPDRMIDDFDYVWHKEKELQRIRNSDYAVYFITKEEQKVGYLITRKTDAILLMSLYIIDGYQRQGIGKQAFAFVANYCKENGENSFTCSCVPENHNARRFYEKMGGKVIGEDLNNEESWMNSVTYQFDF